jgi:type III secretory pathway component EscV
VLVGLDPGFRRLIFTVATAVVTAMSPMHAQMKKRAKEQQQERQPTQHVQTVLAYQEEDQASA